MTLAIVHDLPPRWDGRPVVWQGWTAPIVFMCSIPERACAECGSRRDPSLNAGLVGDSPDLTRAAVKRNDDAIRFHRRMAPARIGWIRLTAFRCPDCGHDVVVDDEGTAWDLEPSDYTDAGSVA